MSGFLAVCVRFSLHRGRGWEGEVSKWFLFCSYLVFSRSFVHDCKTAKCFPNQGEPKFGQIRAKSKAALKFDISRLCPQTFICVLRLHSPLNNIGKGSHFQSSCQILLFTLALSKSKINVKKYEVLLSLRNRYCYFLIILKNVFHQ